MLKRSRLTIRYIFWAVVMLVASSTAFAAVPAAPILTSPTNYDSDPNLSTSTVNGTYVYLDWESVDGEGIYYLLQLSPDGLFNEQMLLMNKYEDTWTSDIYSPLPDNGTKYYWRVFACNADGCGESQTYSFKNGPSAPPAMPYLSSPDDNVRIDGPTATFYWTNSARAAGYYLQIAYDTDFTNRRPITYSEGYLSATVTNMPDNGLTYYWRACAYNSKGETCSSYRKITSGPSAIPEAPTLTYPDNGVDINDLDFALVWDPADRAADYYLQVATDSQFTGSNIVYGNWIGDDYPYYFVGGLLNYGKTYYWRVKAKNSLGESAYSTYRSFKYYDNLTCTSVYGSGIGVTNNTQSHIDTCYASDGSYYLYDISRRTGQQAGHDHTGGMNATEAIKTKDYVGYIYDDDNVWSNDPYYDYRPSVDAHAYAEKVYDYLYNDTKDWQLNSYDGTGSSMVSTVEKPCDDTDTTTARWDRAKVIYYTSCDGAAKSWAGALDLVAHYWGDAVTDKAGSGLLSQSESGALWVAFSDWLGATVENYYDPGDWNWTIGEDILNIQRDLSYPQSYGQPDTYKGLYYVDTENCTPSESNDNCYIHTNSGVPNKMFYLLSQGGTLNGVTVQGIGITKAMKIALKANMGIWQSNTTLKGAVVGMKGIAEDNYGLNSNEATQVKNAWAAVGLALPVITASSSPSAGGTITGGGEYEWGQSVTVTATAAIGYAFDKWTEDGFTVSSDANYTFTANESRNLVANFISVPTYSVIASADANGSISPSTSQIVNYNGTLSFTVIPNTGYHIASVTGCGGALSGNIYTTGVITADCTVTASFAINTYTVTPSAGTNGTISPSTSQTVNYNGTLSFTVTPNTDYHIASVTGCGGTLSGNTYTTGAITANCTVTATFAINTYTVTPSAGPIGSISPSTPQTVNHGSTASFTVTPNTGYQIASVTGCGGTLNGNTYTTGAITADCTVTASFALNTYPLTVSKSGSGTVTSTPAGIDCGSICSASFPQGTTVTLTAVPSQGYTFTGWSGVEGGACSGTGECVLTVNENKSITAVFSQVSQPLDLAFVIDSTGSMWDDIDKVKASAVDIINKIGADVADYRIAVVDYKDHPISPYGGPSDYPYRAVLPFSKDTTAIVNAINSLTASGGADWPESVYSALINTFNAKDLGTWRPEAKKAIILMGDAPPHDPEPVTGYTMDSVIEASYSVASPYASKALALRAAALNPMGTAVTAAPVMIYSIVVGSDNNALEYFTKLSEGTEGKVFTVATSEDVVGGVMDAIDEITTPANRPPVCSSSTASIQEIWPPNHNMKSVNIINVADPDGDPVAITITGITQDEPVKENGSGNTAPDAEGVGTDTAKVRAERTGNINGRVYKISFTAVDDKGLQCTGSVMTCIPHDKGENNVCVDDGQLYDSTSTETEVSLPGNIDVAGPSAKRVDGYDLIKLSIAFGSKSGDLNWNPSCDLDKNGASNDKIDGSDLVVLGTHFGEVGE